MKLIDKDALVAEIERKISSYYLPTEYTAGIKYGLGAALKIINTLEVKEVDSKLTLEDISVLRQTMFDYNRQVKNEMSVPNNEDYCKEILKRFKAQKGGEV